MATVTVLLGNASQTSGGAGPGVVTLPEAEARELIRDGLATRMDGT